MQYFVVVNNLEKSVEISGEVVLPSTAIVVGGVPEFVSRSEGLESYLVVNQVSEIKKFSKRVEGVGSIEDVGDTKGVGSMELLEQSVVDPDKVVESLGEVVSSISPMEFSSEVFSEEEVVKRYQNKIKKGG